MGLTWTSGTLTVGAQLTLVALVRTLQELQSQIAALQHQNALLQAEAAAPGDRNPALQAQVQSQVAAAVPPNLTPTIHEPNISLTNSLGTIPNSWGF